MTTAQIKTQFNQTAEKLGCKARLAGGKSRMEFQEFLGGYTSDGYEIVVKIDAHRFTVLTAKFPQLQD